METYDPKDVSVVVDGLVAHGFADGTFVSATKEEDSYETYVGAQGEVTRSRNANKIGTITLTLKSTSAFNSELLRLSKKKDTFPARVIDRNTGGVRAGGSRAWVQKPADYEAGDEVQEREWNIVVADFNMK